jgi:hypothetical protein
MIHQPIENQVIVAVTIGGIVLLNAAILWFIPRLTRPDLYFAVTVPPGFRDEPDGKLILGRYRKELILGSILAFIVFGAGIALVGIGFAVAGTTIQSAAGFIAFYRARNRVLPHAVQPTMIREAELQPSNRIVPGGWIAAAGPFVLLAVSAGYVWIHGSSHLQLSANPNASPAHAELIPAGKRPSICVNLRSSAVRLCFASIRVHSRLLLLLLLFAQVGEPIVG